MASHKLWSVPAEERKDILKLDWNEATISPSPKVLERIKAIVLQGDFFNYYPSTYNYELHSLLSKYIELPTDNIQYFASSDSLHEYITKMYVSVGDPILILGPTYDNFRLTCEANGAVVHYSTYRNDFSFDSEKFIRDIETVKPSLVYICNPNNPTGNTHSIEYIESLLNKFSNTLFLIDEAYAEFSGVSAKSLISSHRNILISRTMSKAFAMANFRFGYLISSKENVQAISMIRNPKNISTFTQEGVIGALMDIPYMLNYVHQVKESEKYLAGELEKLSDHLSFYTGGGNFVLIKFHSQQIKDSVCEYLENRNIFVRNLSHSSILLDCFRVTLGTKEQMIRVVSEINNFFKA
jgi:histidinol-phosphate aminotransferase